MLSGVAPADAPLLIRAARELGYKGIFSTETAQDAKILNEVAGDNANGFISRRAAPSTPEIRSPYMEEFVKRYTKRRRRVERRGRHQGLRARDHPRHAAEGRQGAIDDTSKFKKTMPEFSMHNPFLKEDDAS